MAEATAISPGDPRLLRCGFAKLQVLVLLALHELRRVHTHKMQSCGVDHVPTLLCLPNESIHCWRLQSDDGFEFFIRKYETLLGRRSSSAQADVVLGDNMNTSRKHASITYNFEKGACIGD